MLLVVDNHDEMVEDIGAELTNFQANAADVNNDIDDHADTYPCSSNLRTDSVVSAAKPKKVEI